MSYLSDLLGNAYKEGMTEDEISAALESIRPAANEAETPAAGDLDKLKRQLSKANSDVAEYKKQLRAKQSEDEIRAQEAAEEKEKILQENADLKRSMNLFNNQSKLIAMGYDAKLAEETATAIVDGDIDKMMDNQAKFLETQKKNMKAEQMRGMSRPPAGAMQPAGEEYDKKISEAQAAGDMAAVAYYTRLRQTDNTEEG